MPAPAVDAFRLTSRGISPCGDIDAHLTQINGNSGVAFIHGHWMLDHQTASADFSKRTSIINLILRQLARRRFPSRTGAHPAGFFLPIQFSRLCISSAFLHLLPSLRNPSSKPINEPRPVSVALFVQFYTAAAGAPARWQPRHQVLAWYISSWTSQVTATAGARWNHLPTMNGVVFECSSCRWNLNLHARGAPDRRFQASPAQRVADSRKNIFC